MPMDDDVLPPTDDEPVVPEPAPGALPADPEAPEDDALQQSSEVAPGWRAGRRSSAFDAPEADALDQATELPAGDADDSFPG
jgi:hypothetical protein